MPRLQIIIASTRPGRVGKPIADWFYEYSKKYNKFDVELIDLKELNLPFLDEPQHPRLGEYRHEHTKKWSEMISRGDVFVIVTPEYNYSFPATIKNALDYLNKEWLNKPVSFISYGGIAAGTRAVQQLRLVTGALKMVNVNECVNIPFVSQHINEAGEFECYESVENSANIMLDKLYLWAINLKEFRNKKK